MVWGTCWDDGQAPGFWPWTQALRALLDERADLHEAVRPELAAVVPELSTDPPAVAGSDTAGRLRAFDSVGRLLARATAHAPVVVILDDPQRSDQSTVDLLRFVAHQRQPGALMLVGAYRPHEIRAGIAASIADLATAAELVALQGLSAPEVEDLVRAVAGTPAAGWARLVHDRSGGHPFFARELCHLLVAGGTPTQVPAVVREAIGRRLANLSMPCLGLLDAAAATGIVLPDVLADVSGADAARIAELIAEAAKAGVLSPADGTNAIRFTHDLYRETIYASLALAQRLDLHHRIAAALLRRRERGSSVFPAELARHFAAAVSVAGSAPAVAWAQAAADADAIRFAFADAAGHLSRARSVIAEAGQRLADDELVGLLTAEADLRLRGGDAVQARELLDSAWTRATSTGQPDLIGAVALGLDRVGARLAMPRTDLLTVLDTARAALDGSDTPTEAQVTAALARQLQHSVPADRPRAQPLAEHAVAIARSLDDPITLASCLLAHHDMLWTAGTATSRAAIAAEIVDLATSGLRDRWAETSEDRRAPRLRR